MLNIIYDLPCIKMSAFYGHCLTQLCLQTRITNQPNHTHKSCTLRLIWWCGVAINWLRLTKGITMPWLEFNSNTAEIRIPGFSPLRSPCLIMGVSIPPIHFHRLVYTIMRTLFTFTFKCSSLPCIIHGYGRITCISLIYLYHMTDYFNSKKP